MYPSIIINNKNFLTLFLRFNKQGQTFITKHQRKVNKSFLFSNQEKCWIKYNDYSMLLMERNILHYLNNPTFYWRTNCRAGSLNPGAATVTTSNEPILKAAYLIAIFERKMAVESWKHMGNTNRPSGSSHVPQLVSL